MWQNYTNAFLGLCLVGVAIFAAATMGTTLAWTVGILGAVIIVLGLWGAGALSPESESRVRHA
ncbi:MAG TPA: hypothetical protein VMU27_02075 [Candidatus Paceibacterota bacterium]|nr:hypothetical protein [Candidatus Paceibacterota bacterium]